MAIATGAIGGKSLRFGSRRLKGRIAVGGIGVCLAVALTACATQPQPLLPAVAPPPPVLPGPPAMPPETSAKPKTIKASYQGSGTAGLPTASGEPYDPNELTAASRNLPIGSTVKVTNPETGRSVKVRINDRGPFVHGRSLDLSRRAAERIGIVHKGVARVKVTRVNSDAASGESESPPSVAMPAAPVAMPPAAPAAMPAAQN
jgi:rare lipoprotein A